jgi:hypothetical protein
MTTNFRVGDVAFVERSPYDDVDFIRRPHIGKTYTVSSIRAELCSDGSQCCFLATDVGLVAFQSTWLSKRPPDEPRADFTPGEWSLCPWKPAKERA